MKVTIYDPEVYDPEDYKRKLRLYFDKFSSDPLMKINPQELSDYELMSKIKSYSEAKTNGNITHCTWVTIESVKEGEYMGKPFKFVEIGFEGNDVFTINFSQFRYLMSSAPTEITFSGYDQSKANYVCTVDNTMVNPENYFPARIGQKLFLIYSLPCVDKFGKLRTCYFFADELTTPSDIRKHIHFAQRRLLKDMLANPAANAPYTTVKLKDESILHNVATNTTYEQAKQVFDEEYRERYQKKLDELLH